MKPPEPLSHSAVRPGGHPRASAPAPLRVLGFWTVVAIVMGNMIGSGVFLLPASLAAYRGLSLVGWLVSAAGAVLLALVFAALARRRAAAGGLYAYTREAFGDLPGFLVAWGYWISTVCTLPALAVAFVGYLDPFVPGIVRSPPAAAAAALAAMWVLIAINVAGVTLAGRVQLVTTVLKVVPLLIVAVGGLWFLHAGVFSLPPPEPDVSTGAQVMSTITLTLWAFLGLESATIPADSIRDPERSIPRATVVGTLLTALVYVATTLGVMSLVPAATLATSTAPLADGAARLLGAGGAQVVALGAAISCFGALNGWTLIVGQLPMAVAADGLFPRAFGRVTSRGTPALAMVAAGVLASLLVAMNYTRELVDLFTFITLLATLSTLVPYVFCSLAVWLIPDRERLGSLGVVSALAFLYAMFAIAGAGAETVFYGFLLLLAGLPLYVHVRRQRNVQLT